MFLAACRRVRPPAGAEGVAHPAQQLAVGVEVAGHVVAETGRCGARRGWCGFHRWPAGCLPGQVAQRLVPAGFKQGLCSCCGGRRCKSPARANPV